jgi:hypothetical protein
MRIATWNLRGGKFESGQPADAFCLANEEIAPDVWVITEPLLCFSPGKEYRCVAYSDEACDIPINPDPRKATDRRWVGIWSKIEARKIEVLSEQDRMACIRVEAPGQPDVIVVGTVLPWRADQRLAPCTGADAFCRCLQIQVAEWERLWGHPRACAFCLAGDFNQEFNRPIVAGSSNGIANLEKELKRLDLVCLTRDMLVGQPPLSAIDHICVGGGLDSHSAGTWAFCRKACPKFPLNLNPLPAPNHPVWCMDSKHCPVTDHYGAYADFNIAFI